MNWPEILAGVALGFSVSIFIWWLQYRVIVPRISFANEVSRVPGSIPNYRLKFKNTGRRAVVDLAVDVRVFLGAGAVEYADGRRLTATTSSLKVYTSASSRERIMRVKPGASRVLRLDLRRSTWADVNPDLLLAVGLWDVPSGESVELETLLTATESAYLRIRILAYDEFTGTRKFFESGKIWSTDVKEGTFRDLHVRPLQPLTDPT